MNTLSIANNNSNIVEKLKQNLKKLKIKNRRKTA